MNRLIDEIVRVLETILDALRPPEPRLVPVPANRPRR